MMFWTLVIGVSLVFAWRAISDLRRRLGELEAAQREATPSMLNELLQRVARLETAIRESGAAAAAPQPPATATPVVPAPVVPAPVVPAPVVPAPVVPAPVVTTPVVTTPGAQEPIVPVATPPQTPVPASPPVPAPARAPAVPIARPTPAAPISTPVAAATAVSDAGRAVPPVPPPPPSARPGAAGPPPPPEDEATWEVVVGTSWLNKIGVLVFVIGVALLVGYSFARIGPLGRVAIGLVLSTAMLAAGVVFERRDRYRAFAYGLIAGGWAGIYFTTFAMHAIPAARIIESDALGAAALLAVAIAMIGHSLKYRSQTVTALAYVVAYVTLALAPQTGFSLVASIPLALSLLAVATRLHWPAVAVLGVVSTYLLFVLRIALFPAEVVQPLTTLPLVALGVYWLMFETADILASRLRGAGGASLSLFPLNAVGMIGAASLQLPVNDATTMAMFTAIASAAYLASAVLRARLRAAAPAIPADAVSTAFETTHWAVALASGLALWSIELRFSGNAQTLALLTEAELLIVAGIALAQRPLRTIGGVVLVVAFADSAMRASLTAIFGDLSTGLLAATTPIAALVALACYLNREVLRARGYAAALIEHTYTWMAFLLAGVVVLHEVPAPYLALAATIAAFLLLEAGLRRAAEYRYQAWCAAAFAAGGVFWRFLLRTDLNLLDQSLQPASPNAVIVLALITGLAYAAAYRLRSAHVDHPSGELETATTAAAGFGTFTLTLLPWYVLPPVAVGPAWAILAAASVAAGAHLTQQGARWHGYALILLASARSLLPLIESAPASTAASVAMAGVIAAVYLIGYLGRRAAVAENPDAAPGLERHLATAIGFAATAAFAVYKWRILPPIAVAPAWAATALVLVLLGRVRGRGGQRWQGYALAVVGGLSALFSLADRAPAVLVDLWSPLAVCAAVYALVAIGRGRFGLGRPDLAAPSELEMLGLTLLSGGATAVLAAVEWRAFHADYVALAWAATGAALMAIGLIGRAADLRWQAYALLFGGAFRTAGVILPEAAASTAALISTASVIALMYGIGLAARRVGVTPDRSDFSDVEDALRIAVSIAATVLLTATIFNEVRPTLVTLGWGLEGLALMVGGFAARERVLRLAGLAVLLGCTLKLFLADLRGLEPLARILSFVVLGLVLLAVSWTYTRYQEQIKKFL